jgi:hypothetical protein
VLLKAIGFPVETVDSESVWKHRVGSESATYFLTYFRNFETEIQVGSRLCNFISFLRSEPLDRLQLGLQYFNLNLREKYSTRTRDASTLFCSILMDQLRPKLNNVLQCLSLNGYSIFSLIDDILAYCNLEDERIKILREGMERDAADICVRLLSLITSGPEKIFGRVKCTCSSSSSGWLVTSTELRTQSRITVIQCRSTYSPTMSCWTYSTSV